MVYCLKFMKGDSSLKPSIKVGEKSVTKQSILMITS